jgi:hypothetical protein
LNPSPNLTDLINAISTFARGNVPLETSNIIDALLGSASPSHSASNVLPLMESAAINFSEFASLVLGLQHEFAEHPTISEGPQCVTSLRQRIPLRRGRFQPGCHQLVETEGEQAAEPGTWFRYSPQATPMTPALRSSSRLTLIVGMEPAANPITSSLPSVASTRTASSNA